MNALIVDWRQDRRPNRFRRPPPLAERLQTSGLSDQAFRAYLLEYEQCAEGYRHAVSTIWQASAVVAAITAGVLAFAFSGGSKADGLSSIAQSLALLPMIVWCFGIYRPLNRYAERKCDVLCRIEERLNRATPGLYMHHFTDYRDHRKGNDQTRSEPKKQEHYRLWNRVRTLKILREPRIVEVVTTCGVGLLALEVVLLAESYLRA
jgi:hypothetical protein